MSWPRAITRPSVRDFKPVTQPWSSATEPWGTVPFLRQNVSGPNESSRLATTKIDWTWRRTSERPTLYQHVETKPSKRLWISPTAGPNHVLECVGAESSLETAGQVVRPGGNIGYVGVPHVEDPAFLEPLFFKNISFTGGPTPVRHYAEDLMKDVLQGTLDPSPIFTKTVDLDGVPEGYEAMDEREALKVLVKPEA